MPNRCTKSENIEVKLQENIQLCLNFGFGTLITANSNENYRNSIISIHNGLELLMKFYLKDKNELLIYNKLNYNLLLSGRKDLIKHPKEVNNNTISYTECITRLEHFSKLPDHYKKYLKQLNDQRNRCVHHEYSYNEKDLRKLLISHTYQFICDLILEMKLNLKDFILDKYTDSIQKFKDTIDDEVEHAYHAKIEAAKKHYYEELTEVERRQKADAGDYTRRTIDIIVKCPACENNALLRRTFQEISEHSNNYVLIKRDVILKDLSCHYCGLNITDYDQLKLQFKEQELSSQNKIYYNDCPDDCQWDCPDDCQEDCPDDCQWDCPDDCQEDCPDDCQEDCPDEV